QNSPFDYCTANLIGGEVAYWDSLCTKSLMPYAGTGSTLTNGGKVGLWTNSVGISAYNWTNRTPSGTSGPVYHSSGFGTNGTQPYVHFDISGGFAEFLNPFGSPANINNPFSILIVLRPDDSFGATLRPVLSDDAELGKPTLYMNTTSLGNYIMGDT